jgi:hypothetical protein
MGGNYNGVAINKKDYKPDGGPTNYVDCMQYWANICDPNEDSNCNITPYKAAQANICLPADETTKCNRNAEKLVKDSKLTNVIDSYTKKTTFVGMKSSMSNNKVLIGSMEIFEDMIHFLGTDTLYRHQNGQSLGVVNVILAKLEGTGNAAVWTVIVPWDRKTSAKASDYTLKIAAGLNHCNLENEAWELTVSTT